MDIQRTQSYAPRQQVGFSATKITVSSEILSTFDRYFHANALEHLVGVAAKNSPPNLKLNITSETIMFDGQPYPFPLISGKVISAAGNYLGSAYPAKPEGGIFDSLDPDKTIKQITAIYLNIGDCLIAGVEKLIKPGIGKIPVHTKLKRWLSNLFKSKSKEKQEVQARLAKLFGTEEK